MGGDLPFSRRRLFLTNVPKLLAPHWIEHPGPEPAVSFEVGYWTADDVRTRKVWDVNWLLRKGKLSPRPPGESESRDRRKRWVFDAMTVVTRKGGEYRGVRGQLSLSRSTSFRRAKPIEPSTGLGSRASNPSSLAR